MSDDLYKEFDELGLQKPGTSGSPPRERLTSPTKLRDCHTRLREDDRINAFNRGLAQALLDGEPPYDQSDLNDGNQPDTTNLNFQGAEQKLERAKAPYDRLIYTGEVLVSVNTDHGPQDERGEWETAMNEEISATIREEESFPYEMDRLITKHVWEGLGIAHWEDDIDWRFRASGLGQFFFPRRVAILESRQEYVTADQEFTISDLYAKISDPESAEKNGWNPAAVRRAIEKATASEPPYNDWERLVEEVKNNDLFVGTRLPTIRAVHGFVKEFDGTVSHYLTTEDGCGHIEEEKFMFKSRQVYRSMTQALVMFPYGRGTNGTVHGNRGLGYKVHPFEQQRNRSIGRLIDKGLQASSLMLQATDETDMANVGLTYYGDCAILPPGVSAPNIAMPDLTRSVIPALDLMDRLVNERTASYSPENVFDGDQRKTKFEIAANLEQSTELSDSSINFFYGPGDRLFQQIVRRMTRREYVPIEPGGEAIADLRKRLVKRGIPLEAFFKIDWKRVKMVRVIGAGSAAAKTIGLQRMGELRPRMDDVGQAALDREVAIDSVGIAGADKFFPKNSDFRTTADTQIAILQNYAIINGQQVPVLSSDKHMAHAREHLKPLLDAYQATAAGEMEEMEFALTFGDLFAHAVEHVSAVEGDPSAIEEAAAMRQMLQQVEEFINNGYKAAEAAEQEAAENPQAAPGGAPQEGPSVEQAERFAKAQAEIEIMKAKADAGISIEVEKNQARIAMDDARTAAEIRRKNMAFTATPPKPAAKKAKPAKGS
jgi:hypothetical protein